VLASGVSVMAVDLGGRLNVVRFVMRGAELGGRSQRFAGKGRRTLGEERGRGSSSETDGASGISSPLG
jgi:hypothetical protein